MKHCPLCENNSLKDLKVGVGVFCSFCELYKLEVVKGRRYVTIQQETFHEEDPQLAEKISRVNCSIKTLLKLDEKLSAQEERLDIISDRQKESSSSSTALEIWKEIEEQRNNVLKGDK